MEKVNPRKIPRTQADVEKAHNQGMMFGFEYAIVLLLFILADKHDAPADDIQILSEEIGSYTESIANGDINYNDIRKALMDDYEIGAVWRGIDRAFGQNRNGGKRW